MKDTVTLVMIVKNESQNLGTCLDSVKNHIDEIVIVDTGSTDSTLDIASRYTDKVYTYPWNGDFAAARNYAIARAGGDWILSLDADESLICAPGQLKELVRRKNNIDAYMLPLLYPVAECTGEYNQFLVLRLFRNKKGYQFRGKIHEQVVVHNNEVVEIADDIVIKHNMASPKERNRKRGRNLAALKKAYLEDPTNYFLQYYLGIEWLGLAKPDKALPFLQNAYRNLTDDHLLFRAPTLRYLLICLNILGQLDEMICLSLEAALKYPDYTDIYYLGGIALEEKKEYKIAVKWFDQAIQCGVPPSIYSHMNGTGSFLALYHMGFCYEKLGMPENAQACYERALHENNQYIYPAGNLFLLILKKRGPRYTLEYFKEKGYLNNLRLALTVADLFFLAGYPDLSERCLGRCSVSSDKSEEVFFQLGRYNIYSGRLKKGLNYMEQIPEGSDFFIDGQTHKAVALLLMGRFNDCRSLGLQMWKNKLTRTTARVILSLSRSMQDGQSPDASTKFIGADLIRASLNILDLCYHYLPGKSTEGSHLTQIINILESIIRRSIPMGDRALQEYYQDRTNSLREFFDYKFGNGGIRT
ncbi:glycosyl transferase family 2 [Desulfotomaculum nigrificans CO-1-SRB]|uniref:Glycosyl transferase family 2 n=1 Tax=Desulfotomaculum nigrificans (strain DSM 14880 / VKM B-2319 / CO-1-SRB) TaxID=868595 RepID=F6B9S3_DESCC|nr:glycosyltransferase family 2 protein [Desulfotomaculum nigrificans]AEF93771.1 glycosyl transferase family 2 [Desulfotomaculum nigrificans CO-1-SRB]